MNNIPQGPRRLAVIGCGRMGRMHAERLAGEPRGTVVAVYDSHPPAARRLADEIATDVRAFDDLHGLLRSGLADAAIICSPTGAHYEQASACLEHGLDVLCEKPLAARRDEIAMLIRDSGSRG